jgi:archaemetzincin
MKLIFLIALIFISCNSNRDNNISIDNDTYFRHISQNDIKLGEPLPGEWRSYYNEARQTPDDYKKLNPKKAQPGKSKIYLLPIGNFSDTQAKVLELTREYLEIFFQLTTELLPAISDAIIPDTAKRMGPENNVQLFTPYILNNLLKGKMAPDGYALMAFSTKDLYPGPKWNFVFGIASYEDRVGVSSIFRLQNSTPGSSNYLIFLRRLLNTASHEIGHMFSIHHCTFAKCVMNGSNSLPESDQQPSRLCSECQHKLFWNIGYDNKKRLTELINYFKRNDLQEDLSALEKDYDSLK